MAGGKLQQAKIKFMLQRWSAMKERPNFSVLYNGAKPCMHRSKCQQISVWCLQTSVSACYVITRSAMPGVLHSKPLATPVRCFASSARCSSSCGQLRSSCRPQPALLPIQRRIVCSAVIQATAAPAAADTERCVRPAPGNCCKARPSTYNCNQSMLRAGKWRRSKPTSA